MSDQRDPEPPHHRFAEAVLFTLSKHGGQEREDGRPYIIHPLRVAESLRTIGGIQDMDVVLAGLMHDLIEDTDCEYANLQRRFGSRVADLVAILSGDMRLPKKARRNDVLERIQNAPPEAKAVRLADRLDNLSDMVGFSETRRQEYAADSWKTLEVCRGANAALEQELEATIRRIQG